MSDSEKPTLLLIDGHSLAYRAFFALPVDRFVTRDGQHTNAIHGFLAMLLLLLKNENPTHVAVAFDVSRHSFRTREYPEYKGNRAETPEEFRGQVPLIQEALAAMKIAVLEKDDFEADDILATLARRGSNEGFRVLVVSGDRDTIQLVDDTVTLLYPSRQGVTELTRYDPAKVVERYGIRPEQYPDVAALVGETSDNLPGIPKVGEKTAVKWITMFGSLQGILDNADEITGKVGESLREHRERAVRNRRLNALVRDVELPLGPTDVRWSEIDEAAVRSVFGRLQFRTLLSRVLALHGINDDAGDAVEVAPPREVAVLPDISVREGADLAVWLSEQTVQYPDGIAFVVSVQAGDISEIGLATESSVVSVPIVPAQANGDPLRAWLASAAPKIMFDAKAQLKACDRAGWSVSGHIIDTLIVDWLQNPGSPSTSLKAVVKRALDEDLPEPDPNQLVPESEPLVAAGEAWYAARVYRSLASQLDAQTSEVLTTIEMPTLSVLAHMEQRGVAVNHDKLSSLSAELGERAADLATRAYAEIGREVNLGSPKQLQDVLFVQLGMPKTRAMKTGFSTDASALADLQEKNPHPFLDLLLEHRDATKLRQIVETVDKTISDDGRVHTRYVQTGTSTGRLSSADPNLQNIPVRTEDGRRIRAAFEVGEGYDSLLTADYSQIEMRIMAHLSDDDELISAFCGGEDLHRFVGARIFSVDPSDVTPLMRTKVKAMSYGLVYGLSSFGLSRQLRVPVGEAKQLMNDYFDRFGKVRDYLRNTVERARVDGYTTTIFGRRRPFPELHSTNRVVRGNAERAALNAPIQGSAADIMKIAMIAIENDFREQTLMSRMLMQVHDELIFEVAAGESETVRRIVRDRMAHAATLRVPLDVQLGAGANWDEAAH